MTIILFLLTALVLTFIYVTAVKKQALKDSQQLKEKVEIPKRKEWLWDEVYAAAFLAKYTNLSENKISIAQMARAMGRTESSLIRKIHRLRAIETGKAPYSSKIDRSVMDLFNKETAKESRDKTHNILKSFFGENTTIDI